MNWAHKKSPKATGTQLDWTGPARLTLDPVPWTKCPPRREIHHTPGITWEGGGTWYPHSSVLTGVRAPGIYRNIPCNELDPPSRRVDNTASFTLSPHTPLRRETIFVFLLCGLFSPNSSNLSLSPLSRYGFELQFLWDFWCLSFVFFIHQLSLLRSCSLSMIHVWDWSRVSSFLSSSESVIFVQGRGEIDNFFFCLHSDFHLDLR